MQLLVVYLAMMLEWLYRGDLGKGEVLLKTEQTDLKKTLLDTK